MIAQRRGCLVCELLVAEHQHRKRIYDLADLRVTSADTSSDAGRCLTLKTLADQARMILEIVETEIVQHQYRHGA